MKKKRSIAKIIILMIMLFASSSVLIWGLNKRKEDFRNLSDLNSKLWDQVKNIELNEDGSLPPIEDDEIYEKTVDYDFENKCWVITAFERNTNYTTCQQVITKCLYINGEYTMFFRYSSQKEYIKQYRYDLLNFCIPLLAVLGICIFGIIAMLKGVHDRKNL